MAPRLSDKQQSAILSAVNPLERYQREAFLTALTLLLEGKSELGDGELFRILRDLQKIHFDWGELTVKSGRELDIDF
jgi:hypothetical protein